MSDFNEELKNAICQNDVVFLETNSARYSINQTFEDENKDSLLLYALSDYDSKAYEYFLDKGADLDLVNNEGETVLHSVVYSGDIERLREIVKLYPKLDKTSNSGASPLLLAIALDKIDIAKELIELGANVNIADDNGVTPLHIACQEGLTELVELLIKRKANLQKKSKQGNLPMSLAVNKGHHEIVKMLYKAIY